MRKTEYNGLPRRYVTVIHHSYSLACMFQRMLSSISDWFKDWNVRYRHEEKISNTLEEGRASARRMERACRWIYAGYIVYKPLRAGVMQYSLHMEWRNS
jgi:hypothetical protein